MSAARALRMRSRVHNIIVREGQAAVLRNAFGERGCFVMEDSYQPREIDGSLIQMGDRRFFMSSLISSDSDNLIGVLPPDAHTDRLVLADPMDDSGEVELLFASPPQWTRTGTVTVYFELHCREP